MESQVTVVIPFYDRSKYLCDALESVFNQTYSCWKLILIDDCSTDNYLPKIEKYLKDKRVMLLHNSENLGQSKTLNNGLKFVETPFVVQLDSDDMFYSNTLEIMVKEARKQPENVGLLFGNVLIFCEDENGKIIKTRIRKGSRSFMDRYDFLLAKTSVSPRFYRTSALKEIGGWPIDDPYEGRYREDMRTLYRLIEHYQFHWIDHILYKVRIHQTNETHQVNFYAEMAEWSIRDALKRWGDEFNPVFTIWEDGWKSLSHLEKKILT